MGNGSLEQEVEVLSWMSWANEELLVTLAKWYRIKHPPHVLPISDLFHRFLPLIPNFASPAPYDHQAVERGKAASLAMLETLESILEERTYLVGDGITLADVFVAIMFSRGLEWVLDAELRARRPSCMRHFSMIASWEPVKVVVPTFKLIDVEPLNRNPYE